MINVFNTTLEISTRMLLVLYAHPATARSCDEIAALDYMTCYAKSFQIGAENLHGDGEFNFVEFTDRQTATERACRYLVTHGLIAANAGNDGFTFTITAEGKELCNRLTSEYAANFQKSLAATFALIQANPGVDVVRFVNHAGNLLAAKGDQ